MRGVREAGRSRERRRLALRQRPVLRVQPEQLASCSSDPLWDALPGTAFCDVAFSRDGSMVASVRGATGLVEPLTLRFASSGQR